MILTVETIQNALNSQFWLGSEEQKENAAIIDVAEKAGYIRRPSHTQAEWIEEGLNNLKLKDVIYRVTGILFSNEKGLEVTVEGFDIVDESSKNIVIREGSYYTVISKEPKEYGAVLGQEKFDSCYELFSVLKCTIYLRGLDSRKSIEVLQACIVNHLQSEIDVKQKFINTIKNAK